MQVYYQINKATEKDIKTHLEAVSQLFIPALSDRVDIKTYSRKIRINALTFEAWHNNQLIGLIACYLNIQQNEVFITNVSILKEYQNSGIALHLMENILNDIQIRRFPQIRLKVYDDNHKAISFYKKNGFVLSKKEDHQYNMILSMTSFF